MGSLVECAGDCTGACASFNAKPAIFAGYRLDTGSTNKGVYQVLDYNAFEGAVARLSDYHECSLRSDFFDGPPMMPLYAVSSSISRVW